MTWLCFRREGLLIDRKKSEGDRRKRAGEESEYPKLINKEQGTYVKEEQG